MAALLRLRGRMDYRAAFAEMQAFTAARTPETPDEIWLCQHPSVFTQGLAGKAEHVRHAGDIPVVQTDRGGQVTYHGPGQVVAYPLIDLRRAGYFVKELVWRAEAAVLQMLADVRIVGTRVAGAPGIYVPLPTAQAARHAHGNHAPASRCPDFSGLGKIAALGLKVRQGCSYHGVALNVCMDLEPFSRIHPCGHTGLHVVDMASCGVHLDWEDAAQRLGQALAQQLAPR